MIAAGGITTQLLYNKYTVWSTRNAVTEKITKMCLDSECEPRHRRVRPSQRFSHFVKVAVETVPENAKKPPTLKINKNKRLCNLPSGNSDEIGKR